MLHVAAGIGDSQAVALLLDTGAKVDAHDRMGGTPLHVAAGAGFPKGKRNQAMRTGESL